MGKPFSKLLRRRYVSSLVLVGFSLIVLFIMLNQVSSLTASGPAQGVVPLTFSMISQCLCPACCPLPQNQTQTEYQPTGGFLYPPAYTTTVLVSVTVLSTTTSVTTSTSTSLSTTLETLTTTTTLNVTFQQTVAQLAIGALVGAGTVGAVMTVYVMRLNSLVKYLKGKISRSDSFSVQVRSGIRRVDDEK